MGRTNSYYIAQLMAGNTVSFRGSGGSMRGRIEPGELCVVGPVDVATLEVGDIMLCKVNRSVFLHLIKEIHDGNFLIANNLGKVNGWITADKIYGKLIRVEP